MELHDVGGVGDINSSKLLQYEMLLITYDDDDNDGDEKILDIYKSD